MIAGRAFRQLEPVFGKERADVIVSFANGIDKQLAENPVASSFTAPTVFPAMAVLYGHARRVCAEVMDDLNQPEDVREDARRTLADMTRAAEATDAADPKPPQALQAPQGMSIGELLAQAGVVVADATDDSNNDHEDDGA